MENAHEAELVRFFMTTLKFHEAKPHKGKEAEDSVKEGRSSERGEEKARAGVQAVDVPTQALGAEVAVAEAVEADTCLLPKLPLQ